MEQKYSLFQIEKQYGTISDNHFVGYESNSSMLVIACFEYFATFDSLEDAKAKQKKYHFKTIIIPTY